MKLILTNKAYNIIREVADKIHCPYEYTDCHNCPLRIFDNEENRCSDNAKMLLKLLEGQK